MRSTQDERWLAAPGYEGFYEVSDLGRVRSVDNPHKTSHKKGRVLKQATVLGYSTVNFSVATKRQKQKVHKLVMSAFVGPCPDGMEVAHNDGDRSNNRLSNLRYATAQGNYADRYAHGTDQSGERNPRSILTNDMVRMIRALKGRIHQGKIAAICGVSRKTINAIHTGRTWKHIHSDDIAAAIGKPVEGVHA